MSRGKLKRIKGAGLFNNPGMTPYDFDRRLEQPVSDRKLNEWWNDYKDRTDVYDPWLEDEMKKRREAREEQEKRNWSRVLRRIQTGERKQRKLAPAHDPAPYTALELLNSAKQMIESSDCSKEMLDHYNREIQKLTPLCTYEKLKEYCIYRIDKEEKQLEENLKKPNNDYKIKLNRDRLEEWKQEKHRLEHEQEI
jgi:hypothetical protein